MGITLTYLKFNYVLELWIKLDWTLLIFLANFWINLDDMVIAVVMNVLIVCGMSWDSGTLGCGMCGLVCLWGSWCVEEENIHVCQCEVRCRSNIIGTIGGKSIVNCLTTNTGNLTLWTLRHIQHPRITFILYIQCLRNWTREMYDNLSLVFNFCSTNFMEILSTQLIHRWSTAEWQEQTKSSVHENIVLLALIVLWGSMYT
jgi:hypothetical protein